MTENYPPVTMPSQGEPQPPAMAAGQDTAEAVKNQASDLGHSSVQAGKHVTDVAREQASGVAAEAGRQGRDLLQQAQGQLQDQAAQGQQRLARQLLSVSDELRSMADAPGRDGVAAGLAHQAASRARDAGQWLDNRDPRQVVNEVQSFARRRPAVFLALAAGAGVVAGRLTRGLKDASSDDPASTPAPASPSAQRLSGHGAQPPGMTGYPLESEAVVSDDSLGLPAPAGGLAPASAAWEAGPAGSEGSPLVTDDPARQDTL